MKKRGHSSPEKKAMSSDSDFSEESPPAIKTTYLEREDTFF